MDMKKMHVLIVLVAVGALIFYLNTRNKEVVKNTTSAASPNIVKNSPTPPKALVSAPASPLNSISKALESCHIQTELPASAPDKKELRYENIHIQLNNGKIIRLRRFIEKEMKEVFLVENKDGFPLLSTWPEEIKKLSFDEKTNYFLRDGKKIYHETGENWSWNNSQTQLYIEFKNEVPKFIQNDDIKDSWECRI